MSGKSTKPYVYLLVDPRDDTVFYVGKGTGRRASVHAAKVRRGHVDNPQKCARIREIHEAELEVIERIHTEFETDADAYEAERVLIGEMEGLTNLTSGYSTAEERSRESARNMLARLKPFETWLATAGEETLAMARRVFGTERNCYNSIRGGLVEVAHA